MQPLLQNFKTITLKLYNLIPNKIKTFLLYHVLVYKEAGYNPIFYTFKIFFFPVDFKRDCSSLKWWDYAFLLLTLAIYVWLIEWILRIILINWGLDLWLPLVMLFSMLTIYFFGNMMMTLVLSFAVFPFVLVFRGARRLLKGSKPNLKK